MQSEETSHFWVGHLPEDVADDYFAETYHPDRDDIPISPFARDQGVTWYDHDFLEYGRGEADTIHELVDGYSFSDQWAGELARRVAEASLSGFNAFAFISQGEIERPRSVEGDGYWLRYLGVIKYPI